MRLRDLTEDVDGSDFDGTDASKEEATDDDEYCLINPQHLVRGALAVAGGAGAGGGAGGGRPPQVGTPPIY